MTRFHIVRLIFLAAVLTAVMAGAGFVRGKPALAAEPVTVLVQFEAGVTSAERDAAIAGMGGELAAWLPQINVAEVRLGVGDGTVAAAAVPLSRQARVTFAEVDAPVSGAYLPTDPAFVEADRVYGLDRIRAAGAWDYTTGTADVVVAVVDSGIKLDHPEFAGRLTAGHDFVNDDDVPDDDAGHGTHAAGIIAAAMDNGAGSAGVCPRCMLMPVKVLGENNLGTWSNLSQGILYAVDHGADVVNLSLGGPVPSQTLAAAVAYAQEHGVLIVAAAGNYGSDKPYYPAALDGVIGVGATTAADTLWQNSNYGPAVDVVAPGDLIFSTYHQMDNVFGGYMYLSGTSMATPHVSGLAGLMLSLSPSLTAAEVTALIQRGADDLGALGHDDVFGYGRINAAMAVALVGASSSMEPKVTATRDHFALFLPVLTH